MIALAGYLNLLSGASQAVGVLGERLVAHWLQASGYSVRMAGLGKKTGDLLAVRGSRSVRVEVKTARAAVDGKWRFCLRKRDKYGSTDCRYADVVVLVAVLRSGWCVPFVIPVGDIEGERVQITITSRPDRYRGRWAAYRQGKTADLEV